MALCAARSGRWWFADWASLFASPGLAMDRDAAVGAVCMDPQALVCLPEALRHDIAVVSAAQQTLAHRPSLLTSLRTLRLDSIGLCMGAKDGFANTDAEPKDPRQRLALTDVAPK